MRRLYETQNQSHHFRTCRHFYPLQCERWDVRCYWEHGKVNGSQPSHRGMMWSAGQDKVYPGEYWGIDKIQPQSLVFFGRGELWCQEGERWGDCEEAHGGGVSRFRRTSDARVMAQSSRKAVFTRSLSARHSSTVAPFTSTFDCLFIKWRSVWCMFISMLIPLDFFLG
jgi:hypothetical protein